MVNTSQTNFDLMYKVKIKRLAKGLSREELSFLLGYEEGKVADIELLQANYKDLHVLSLIFNCQITDLSPIESHSTSLKLKMYEVLSEGIITYTAENLDTGTLLFMIREDDPEKVHPTNLEDEIYIKTEELIYNFLESGFFDLIPRSPFLIFQLASIYFNSENLLPRHVYKALSFFTTRASGLALKRFHIEGLDFVYQKR